MILVLGATGTTGGEVARQLIAAGERPRLLVRDPAKAQAYAGGAEVVAGDLGDADSLAAAMRGVSHLYLVSPVPTAEPAVIDAARQAGVEHVVKLSVVGADDPVLIFSKWHAASERHLMESGLQWTMLRPGNFMTNALAWADTIRAEGVFYQPTGDARYATIDPRDIATVAVQALTQPGHAGQGYTLTGPEALSAAEYAERLSAVLGKPVRHVDVPPEAAQAGMRASGMPESYVEALLDLLAAMKAGHASATTDTFTRLTGRAPGTFDAWAQRHAAAFR